MSEAYEKVAALYREKAARGLVDVKFFLVDLEGATLDAVCEEVLALEAALPLAKPFSFGDSRQPTSPQPDHPRS